MNKSNKLLILPLLLSCLHSTVFAGGALVTQTGQPIHYSNGGTDITLNYDQGPLGLRTNEQADALINQALSLWNNVTTSTVNIQPALDLPEDVNENNFTTYLNDFDLSTFFDGLNPVIFDSNGEIIDAMYGVGQKDHILGFAGSASYDNGTAVEGRAIINGFYPI